MINEVTLNKDQQGVFNLLKDTNDNLFITGAAGTGKTHVINSWLASLDNEERSDVAVLGSTGVSALLIGGQTFHSFFGIGLAQEQDDKLVEKAFKKPHVWGNITSSEVILIDEISMLSGRLLNIGSRICQKITGNENVAWGGLRVILMGDFFQLPPVQNSNKKDWAFNSEAWKSANIKTFELTEFMRADHANYHDVLSKIRIGIIDSEVEYFLNSRKSRVNETSDITRLMPRVAEVDRINNTKLKQLNNEIRTFNATSSGDSNKIKSLMNTLPVPERLELAVGAKVMLRSNRVKMGLVNGSVGHVTGFNKDGLGVYVVFDDIENLIYPITWESRNYRGKVLAGVTQIPLCLSWAITIHKSQGASIQEMSVNVSDLWESGQAYVGLSRSSDPNRLVIEDWSKNSIRIDRDVWKFYFGEGN